jgi:hypothetical protein
VRRILLVLMVALVMVVMLAMAMPVFAQVADPCTTGDTPSSPPDAGAAPSFPPPLVPPGYIVMAYPDDRAEHSLGGGHFTGPNVNDDTRCFHSQ